MTLRILAAALLLAVFCFGSPAKAANPDHITQLMEQRHCVSCDLTGADLTNKDLRGVNLTHANLEGADLSDADMMAVILKNANLKDAKLDRANLMVVDFTDANLTGATMSNTSLSSSRICHTTSPNGKTYNRDC